jgi:hypothetical protein
MDETSALSITMMQMGQVRRLSLEYKMSTSSRPGVNDKHFLESRARGFQ